jgi:hypothetical protein
VAVVITSVDVAGRVNCCLEYDTPVRTPEGVRTIGELQVGDPIITVDPESGEETSSRVQRVFHTVGWCRRLEIEGRSVWLTAEPPIYSPERGEFRTAENWLVGELVATLADDGG